MKLTPEQIAAGWREHDGSYVCPIKDDRTRFEFMQQEGVPSGETSAAYRFRWVAIVAYRIIEAHGADAAPARPTPYPAGYDELVFDADGWSQTIIVDGKRPEWMRDDDAVRRFGKGMEWEGRHELPDDLFAIRVRRREPKRETTGCVIYVPATNTNAVGTIDLIDGEPDLSTLKIAEDAL